MYHCFASLIMNNWPHKPRSRHEMYWHFFHGLPTDLGTDRAGSPGKAGRREPTEREVQEKPADENRPSGKSRKGQPAGTDRAGSPGKASRREPTEREVQERPAGGNRPSGKSGTDRAGSPGKASRREPTEREFPTKPYGTTHHHPQAFCVLRAFPYLRHFYT